MKTMDERSDIAPTQQICFHFYNVGEVVILLIVNNVLKAMWQYLKKMANTKLGLVYIDAILNCEWKILHCSRY